MKSFCVDRGDLYEQYELFARPVGGPCRFLLRMAGGWYKSIRFLSGFLGLDFYFGCQIRTSGARASGSSL